MSDNTNLSTKDKIKKFGASVIKFAKVVRVFGIIGIVGCSVGMILTGMALSPTIEKQLVDKLGTMSDHIKLETHHVDYGIVSFTDSATLTDLHNSGELHDAMQHAIGNLAVGLIYCILALIIVKIVSRTFSKIIESESPFSVDLLKDIKSLFIVIIILSAANSLGLAILIGLTLRCLYAIFKYGCELQTESDHTL